MRKELEAVGGGASTADEEEEGLPPMRFSQMSEGLEMLLRATEECSQEVPAPESGGGDS